VKTRRPRAIEGAAENGTSKQDPTPRPLPEPSRADLTAIRRRIRLADIIHKLTWDLNDISRLTGLSRRLLERLLAGGEMPCADFVKSRRRLWRSATIRRWVEGGDGK
jgi:hypothetical protein